MSKKVLTEEQQRLVEENHNLIYHMMKRRGLSFNSVVDWYGIAAIALCNAAMAYDSSLGEFATFACKCISNAFGQEMRRESKRPVCVDDLLKFDNDEDTQMVKIQVEDPNDPFYEVYVKDAIDHLPPNERQKDMLMMFLFEGYTQVEIAKIFHISRQRVSEIILQSLYKMKNYVGE